jgi:hypothetical protein
MPLLRHTLHSLYCENAMSATWKGNCTRVAVFMTNSIAYWLLVTPRIRHAQGQASIKKAQDRCQMQRRENMHLLRQRRGYSHTVYSAMRSFYLAVLPMRVTLRLN